jgi:hypothetical protein
MEPGGNIVKGNGFMRQQGGGVVTCAGSTVTLVPATAYADERAAALYGIVNERRASTSNVMLRFEPDYPAYKTLVKQTMCDAQGNFTFERVADGTFYVTTFVNWKVGASQQGAALAIRVVVAGGQTTSVVISG